MTALVFLAVTDRLVRGRSAGRPVRGCSFGAAEREIQIQIPFQ